MYNLPDDYNMGWMHCRKHNVKYHLSDGCCDYCLEEASPIPKEGDYEEGYVWIDYQDNHLLVSESCKKGYSMVQKGFAYAIYFNEKGKMIGGARYNTKEEAYEIGEELVVVIPK